MYHIKAAQQSFDVESLVQTDVAVFVPLDMHSNHVGWFAEILRVEGCFSEFSDNSLRFCFAVGGDQ